jgi:hypothetical protein
MFGQANEHLARVAVEAYLDARGRNIGMKQRASLAGRASPRENNSTAFKGCSTVSAV